MNDAVPETRKSRRRFVRWMLLVLALAAVGAVVWMKSTPAFPPEVWVDEHSVSPRGPDRSSFGHGLFRIGSVFSPEPYERPGVCPLTDVWVSPWDDEGPVRSFSVSPYTKLDGYLESVSYSARDAIRPYAIYVMTDTEVEVDGVLWTKCVAIDRDELKRMKLAAK